MKIALFFGSFNPLTLAHEEIIQSVSKSKVVDELWISVTPQSIWKKNETNYQYIPYNIRKEIVSTFIKKEETIKIIDVEEKEEPRETSYFIDKLKTQYPNFDFYFICGKDVLFDLPRWKNFYEKFLPNCNFICFERDVNNKSNSIIDSDIMEKTIFFNTDNKHISATEVREKINRKENTNFISKKTQKILEKYVK